MEPERGDKDTKALEAPRAGSFISPRHEIDTLIHQTHQTWQSQGHQFCMHSSGESLRPCNSQLALWGSTPDVQIQHQLFG